EQGCSPGAPHEQREEREEQRTADEAELLPHDREDEVGVLRGHVAQVRERAVEQTGALEAAVADRLLRLVQGVLREGRAVGVVRRVQGAGGGARGRGGARALLEKAWERVEPVAVELAGRDERAHE